MEQAHSQLVEDRRIADTYASSTITRKIGLLYNKLRNVFFEVYVILTIAITLLAVLVFSFSLQ